jgi:hypothetical protein
MMRRQARSSTRITGRREIHDLGSPYLSRSQNPVDLTDRRESGAKRLRRSPGCPPSDEPPPFRAGRTGDFGGEVTFAGRGRRPRRCGASQPESTQRGRDGAAGDRRSTSMRSTCRVRPVVPGVFTPALGHVIRPRRPRPPIAEGRPAGT